MHALSGAACDYGKIEITADMFFYDGCHLCYFSTSTTSIIVVKLSSSTRQANV